MRYRNIQITVDDVLLKQVDKQASTEKRPRSEFIRRALKLYLELIHRNEIDKAYARGYAGKADETRSEFEDLILNQAWPK